MFQIHQQFSAMKTRRKVPNSKKVGHVVNTAYACFNKKNFKLLKILSHIFLLL